MSSSSSSTTNLTPASSLLGTREGKLSSSGTYSAVQQHPNESVARQEEESQHFTHSIRDMIASITTSSWCMTFQGCVLAVYMRLSIWAALTEERSLYANSATEAQHISQELYEKGFLNAAQIVRTAIEGDQGGMLCIGDSDANLHTFRHMILVSSKPEARQGPRDRSQAMQQQVRFAISWVTCSLQFNLYTSVLTLIVCLLVSVWLGWRVGLFFGILKVGLDLMVARIDPTRDVAVRLMQDMCYVDEESGVIHIVPLHARTHGQRHSHGAEQLVIVEQSR